MYFCLFFLFDENKNINKQQVLIVYQAIVSKGIKREKVKDAPGLRTLDPPLGPPSTRAEIFRQSHL